MKIRRIDNFNFLKLFLQNSVKVQRKVAGGMSRSSVRADLHTSLEQQRPSCAHDTRTDSRPR